MLEASSILIGVLFELVSTRLGAILVPSIALGGYAIFLAYKGLATEDVHRLAITVDEDRVGINSLPTKQYSMIHPEVVAQLNELNKSVADKLVPLQEIVRKAQRTPSWWTIPAWFRLQVQLYTSDDLRSARDGANHCRRELRAAVRNGKVNYLQWITQISPAAIAPTGSTSQGRETSSSGADAVNDNSHTANNTSTSSPVANNLNANTTSNIIDITSNTTGDTDEGDLFGGDRPGGGLWIELRRRCGRSVSPSSPGSVEMV